MYSGVSEGAAAVCTHATHEHAAYAHPANSTQKAHKPQHTWNTGQHNKRSFLLGFHLNNQLTQSLTSRYRDSRLRVDFERFVSCAARLTCIFRHCSQHLDGGEGVICLTHKQVSWHKATAHS